MKTIIQVHKDGKFYVAADLITNIADQGVTEKEAVANLKKGLEAHYRILMELTPKDRKISLIDIEVEKYVKASRPVRSAVRKMADELDNVPKAVLEMIEESSQRGLTMEHVRKASKDAGRTAHKRKCIR